MSEGETPAPPTPGPNEIAAKAVMDQMTQATGASTGMNLPPALMAKIASAEMEAKVFEKLVKEALQILLKNQTLTYSKLQHIESMLTEMGAKPA